MDENFSLEKKIEQIKVIVEKMQKGVIDFDEHVALFKEGIQLVKDCQQYLEGAEAKIQQLVDGTWQELDQE